VPGAAVVSSLEARAQVVLAAHGEYLARARAPAPAIGRLTPGAAVAVKVGDKTHGGIVQSVGLEPVDGKAGEGALHEVTVLFQSAETLRPGLSARLDLP
jgi:hypothetical protein